MSERFCDIKDGAVSNIIKASAEFAQENGMIPWARGVDIGWLYDGSTFSPPPDNRKIEDVKVILRRQVKATYARAMLPISKEYPAEEREGWAEQIQAAQEVLAGGQNDLIDVLRAPTGETATEMASRIAAKREEYLVAYGQVTAARRGLDAQIEAATTLADLDAIDVNAAFGV